MPSLIDLRRRIRSVRNTQQITKAMKMVAAARLRRAQERVISARPYWRMLEEALLNIAAATRQDDAVAAHPLLAVREERKVQLVLVTSDRGLAGAFNSNLIRTAQEFFSAHGAENVQLEVLGRKGRDFFTRRNVNISGERTGISQSADWDDATELAGKLMARYTNGEIDAVHLIFNEFKSVLSQRVVVKKILPIALPGGEASSEYICEQPPAALLGSLLPRAIQLSVFHAMLESAAAEHAARMTAMDSATTNATDVIEKLTLYLNQVRQASITREIIEVVSGASALD